MNRMLHAVFCHFACVSRWELLQRNREASDIGAAPGHANSTPHFPGSPVANNSCPQRPYHTEYNHIVQLEMGNLIQITEEGTKTFSSTQCCLFWGGGGHISQTYEWVKDSRPILEGNAELKQHSKRPQAATTTKNHRVLPELRPFRLQCS